MTDERKKFILIVGISGTVTVVVEARDKDDAAALVENFRCRLGCLEDAQINFVEVEDAAPQDELDRVVDAEDPLFPQRLLLDRTEP